MILAHSQTSQVGCVNWISDLLSKQKCMKIPTMTLSDFFIYFPPSLLSPWVSVPTLLTHLPGGDKEMFDFSKLKIGDDVIAFDAAGAIM
jgi:hypothetical protein